MALKFGEGYVPIYLTGMGGFTTGLARARAVFQQSLTSMEAVARRARIGLLLGAAIGAGVVKAAASFEQGMARVQALTNATGEEFDSLRTQALLLGRTTVYSARQASDAMGYFALAGYSTDKILRAMPATLNLAAAGQMDVAQAADIAAKLMAGMGVEAKDLDHAVDVMAKAFTTSNTDLVQLGSAFKYVGPVAKSAGVSLEEITATLMAVSNAGIQASMAGTTMRGVLARLAGQPNELKKIFAELGVTITTTGGRLRPLADIFDDLNRAMAGMGEVDQMGKMITAFGLRAGPGLLELLSVGGDAIREMQASLEDAGGTAGRIAKIQLDTLQGSWIMLKSAAEGLAIELGDQLIPHMRSFVDRLKEVAAYLAGLTDEEQRSIVAMAAMAMRLLALLTVMPMVAAAMGGLGMAVLAFGGAPVGAIVALTAAVSAFLMVAIEAKARGVEFGEMLAHYADHIAGVESSLDRATTATEKWRNANEKLRKVLEEIGEIEPTAGKEGEPAGESVPETVHAFREAMTENQRQQADVEKQIRSGKVLPGWLAAIYPPLFKEKEKIDEFENWLRTAPIEEIIEKSASVPGGGAKGLGGIQRVTALAQELGQLRAQGAMMAAGEREAKRAEIEKYFRGKGVTEEETKQTTAQWLESIAQELIGRRASGGALYADIQKAAPLWDRIARQRMQGVGPAEPWMARPSFEEKQLALAEGKLKWLEEEKAEASKQRPGVEFTSPLEFWKQMQQRISTEQLDKRRNELLDNIDKNIEKTKTAIEKLKGGVTAGA